MRTRITLYIVCAHLAACQLVYPNVVEHDRNDAGGGGSAGSTSGPWCKTQGAHTFCSDFDEFTVEQGWDNKSETHPGVTVVQDDAIAKSAPYSMLCSIPALTTSDYPVSGVNKTAALDPGGVRISFDVRLDLIDASYPYVVWLHSFEASVTAVGTIDLNLTQHQDGTYLDEDRYFNDNTDTHTSYPLSSSLEVGKWTRVTIEVGAVDGGASTTATVRFDEDVVLADPVTVTAYDPTQTRRFSLGPQVRGGPSNPWQVRYDNYTIDSPL